MYNEIMQGLEEILVAEHISNMPEEHKRLAILIGRKLAEDCQHPTVYQRNWDKSDPDGGSVICTVCDEDLGWWCPDSPNHVCEYFGHHSYTPKWAARGDGRYSNHDDCIYCHQPEERK